MERHGVRALPCNDKDYPARLKEIYDFPPVLYVRGTLKPEDEWCLAVVGTRRATVYGKQVTEEITADLARSRITVVSGLARGRPIPSAHRAALAAGGRTIAVFVQRVWISSIRREEEDGAHDIAAGRALLSEYPLGMRRGRRT